MIVVGPSAGNAGPRGLNSQLSKQTVALQNGKNTAIWYSATEYYYMVLSGRDKSRAADCSSCCEHKMKQDLDSSDRGTEHIFP